MSAVSGDEECAAGLLNAGATVPTALELDADAELRLRKTLRGQFDRRVAATAVLSATLLAASAAVVLSRSLLRSSPLESDFSVGGADIEVKDLVYGKSDCGMYETNTDYWTKKSLYQTTGVLSGEACRSHCKFDKECGAWTWGAVRNVTGLSDVCYLKVLRSGEKFEKVKKPGVNSGMRDELPCEPPQTAADERKKFVRNGVIRNQHGICLDGERNTKDGKVQMNPCRADDWNQMWAYDEGDGQIKNLHGICLDGDRETEGGVVRMMTCDKESQNQRWAYGESRGQIKNRHGLCLDAAEWNEEGGLVQMSKCDVNVVGQQWRLGKAHCDEQTWPDKDHDLVCGECKVLVDQMDSKYKSCDGYCATLGMNCAGAWEEKFDTCKVKVDMMCNETSTSSDALCECMPKDKNSSEMPKKHHSQGTLYCFALMQPYSYEQQLLEMQYNDKVSLFACDGYTVYSNQAIDVEQGLVAHVIDSDLKCEMGGEFKTALNLPIFLAVWKKVISDGTYLKHHWTVKVDPDAVFFPDRLREVLRFHPEVEEGVYLNNCKFGMHGPLEVFSRNAVKAWANGTDKCLKHFNKLCSGDCLWGEDMFIDQCLWKVLKVKREDDWSLLLEDHCDPPPGWTSCSDDSRVAFHPYKVVDGYKQCLQNAQA